MIDIKKCALCPNVLSTKNRTKEHIIPNAIGGRKKTTGFICNECNKKFGEQWDSELAKQLNWFSLTAGIRRERGESPKQLVQTIEGEKYWLCNDGSLEPEKSSYFEEKVGDAIQVHFVAKTFEEARQRLKGIARKYPAYDIEKARRELKIENSYLTSPLRISLLFGGPNAARSLVKTAFAFASDCGVAHDQCEKALEYLLNPEIRIVPFGHIYSYDLIEDRPKDKIFHCVSLCGDPKSKQLWSYVEYFGFFRLIVLLSERYEGPYINEIYAINPVDGERVSMKIVTSINKEDILRIVGGEGMDPEKNLSAMEYAISIIRSIEIRRIWGQKLKESIVYAYDQLGINDKEIISVEQNDKLSELVMEKMAPFVENLIRIKSIGY